MTDEIHSCILEVSENVFHKIIFADIDIKREFLMSERKFCLHEIRDRYASMAAFELREARSNLRLKQVKHAKFKGYKPVTKNGTEWYFSPEKVDEPTLA